MADTTETREIKSQVCRNGAHSIKAPPSNTSVRNYDGAQVINTRKDYSMAYMFGTSQKIRMNGLKSSRAADIRKIKLQQLLQRLLWRHPNKDYSIN